MPEHSEHDATEAAEREMEQDANAMREGVERLDRHIEEAERRRGSVRAWCRDGTRSPAGGIGAISNA